MFIYVAFCCVYSLEESGSTALAPALIISIAMAARVPGSRVIYIHTCSSIICVRTCIFYVRRLLCVRMGWPMLDWEALMVSA